MQKLLVASVRFYQLTLSALLGPRCRFTPSCSHYAIAAIHRHGSAKGCWLTAKRLLKCHPLCAGGYDPVPPKISNEK